jgi:phosphatidylethanolamine/phosphatidyl-N-methylethanolamine N-methyltransferase
MPLPALQLLEIKFEQQKRMFELKKGALERKIEQHIAFFEERKDAFERKIERQIKGHKRKFEESFESLDDDMRFFRTWFEKPLRVGAVTPSSKALARTMAAYIDPAAPGPIIELGPGTGPITEALVAQGIDPGRLVLVEFDATFCRLLRARYPSATVVQGDAYGLKRILGNFLREPAAAVVSGLPLFTKPLRVRLRLLFEAFGLMLPGAPFVQFTYNALAPMPTRLDRVRVQASERVWMNIPPARVWVYRRD